MAEKEIITGSAIENNPNKKINISGVIKIASLANIPINIKLRKEEKLFGFFIEKLMLLILFFSLTIFLIRIKFIISPLM